VNAPLPVPPERRRWVELAGLLVLLAVAGSGPISVPPVGFPTEHGALPRAAALVGTLRH